MLLLSDSVLLLNFLRHAFPVERGGAPTSACSETGGGAPTSLLGGWDRHSDICTSSRSSGGNRSSCCRTAVFRADGLSG